MGETIKPFLCDSMEPSIIRGEWQKWFRSFALYLNSEEITDTVKKKNKLLHYAGPQLQEVIFSLPGALPDYDDEEKNDVYKILTDKLEEYFSPTRNSSFERHLFRNMKPVSSESLNKYLIRLRQQATKCDFGANAEESQRINIKDKLIDGWATVDLKKKLLEKEYTLDEVIGMCVIHEQINCQSKTMVEIPCLNTGVNKIASRPSTAMSECTRCGQYGHMMDSLNCPARSSKCNKCGYFGHFERKCKTKTNKRAAYIPNHAIRGGKRRKVDSSSFKIRCIEENLTQDESDELKTFDCFKIEDDLHDDSDQNINCRIGGKNIVMVIDSGSRFNLLTEHDYQTLCQNKAVMWNFRKDTEVQFRAYAGDSLLEIKGVFEAPVSVDYIHEIVGTFYVIGNGNDSLLGRETSKKLNVLRLGLERVHKIEEKPRKFSKIKGIVVQLSINRSVKPVQQPLRRIPIAIEEKVEARLKEALELDIIEPVVGPSVWISPIVCVFKENGDLRLCIDMRRANQAIQRENFPLPIFDTFMTKLEGSKYFSRLDLHNAYHQLELHEDSRYITTFITHKGLFRYKRLMFGVNSAPEIFQRVFEGILASCKNCLNYLDDIIIYGENEEQHDTALKDVLKKLEEYNVSLNKEKCIFKVSTLKFLGHRLTSQGIHPDPEKVKTITEFREPISKEETRSFLGLVTYLGKFIPDLADTTEPLRKLTKKDIKFNWGKAQQDAFQKLKELLAQVPMLFYFNSSLRTRLIVDASPVALGAVLLQFENDDPKPISFASRSLSEVEQRYSQTEKEGLALVWGVERFYYYLYGIQFELVTDHKPLEAIFNPTSKPPARIERWVLRLQSFRFKVIYQAGKYNIADSLSRLCKISAVESFDKTCEYNIYSIVENSTPKAMTISQIDLKSLEDAELIQVMECMKDDTWDLHPKSPYFVFRKELTNCGNIIIRGTRLVIPIDLRNQVLNLAHQGHPGETVMKRRLRLKVWWPSIDREVEKFVKSCRDCLMVSRPIKPAPMARHKFPDGPWLWLSMDLLETIDHEYIFVIIDYFSRYQEIKFLKRITSTEIIKCLEEIFSRLGYPESITADNGKQFVSNEFKTYCKDNNIELVTSPPYWPQANGEVENMNRSLMKRLKIANLNQLDLKTEVQKFLLMYNVTPHGTTGKTPTELIFNRNIRDKIPSVSDLFEKECDIEARDRDAILKHKGKEREDINRGARVPDINVGDKVLLKNVICPNKLTPTFGKDEYEVTRKDNNDVTVSSDGKSYRRNISHLKKIPPVLDTCSNPEAASISNHDKMIGPTEASDIIQSEEVDSNERNSDSSDAKVERLKLEKKEECGD